MLKKIYGLALMLVMLFVSTTAMAQSVTVTGNVTDQTGEVVIGASILEKVLAMVQSPTSMVISPSQLTPMLLW